MNHNFPVNPSPFTQHHATSTYPAAPAMNGASSPAVPAQYYPMHPTAYPPAPHGYAPYPQYPQQMMMYGPPRPNTSLPEQQQPAPHQQQQPLVSSPSLTQVPVATTAGKRKRRTDAARARDRESDNEGPSSENVPKPTPPMPSAVTPIDTKKRTKTQRACDSCRSRKIRLAHYISRCTYHTQTIADVTCSPTQTPRSVSIASNTVSSAPSFYPLRRHVSKRKSSKKILRLKKKRTDPQTFSETRRLPRQILRWIILSMVCFSFPCQPVN